MGRTQRTYRMRMLDIRDRMVRNVRSPTLREKYRKLWVSAHNLSAEASTFPWPNTHGVATFCMVLEAWNRAKSLETKVEMLKHQITLPKSHEHESTQNH